MLRNEIPGSHGTLYTGIVNLSVSLSACLCLSLLILTLFVLGSGGEGGHMHTHASLRAFKGEDGFPHI